MSTHTPLEALDQLLGTIRTAVAIYLDSTKPTPVEPPAPAPAPVEPPAPAPAPVEPPAPPPPGTVTSGLPAAEGASFTLGAAGTVRYGNPSGTKFNDMQLAAGTYVCGEHTSQEDPAFGEAKTCALFVAASPVEPPAPAPAPPAPPSSDLHALAYQLTEPAGLAMRFGTALTRTDIPVLPERPVVGYFQNGPVSSPWSLGPPNNDPNLYMTVGLNTIGRPKVGLPVSVETSIGVSQNAAIGGEAAFMTPHAPWQKGGKVFSESMENYIARGELLANDPADRVVASFRGGNQADSPVTRLALCATQGSATRGPRIFTDGTVTAMNQAICALPVGYVVTAITSTGTGEFAAVAVWDTNLGVGKVVFIALGGTSDGTYLGDMPGTWKNGRVPYVWWGNPLDLYPGFMSQGNYSFMKVIGEITLPANCKAPSAINATTGMNHLRAVKYRNGNINNFAELNFPWADNLSKMAPGGEDFEKYPKGAAVVVASGQEGTGCVIDMKPLMSYYNDMYFGSAAKHAETRNMGQGASQWPYLIADHPESAPVIVKELSGLGEVRNIWMTQIDTPFPIAVAVTKTGTAKVFSLGRYAPGEFVKAPAPADIAQVGSLSGLGDNITDVAYCKGHASVGEGAGNKAFWVCDRQNKAAKLVKLATDAGGAVTGTVSTVIQSGDCDMIFIAQVDNYHTMWNTMTVGDHAGASIRNYRFDVIDYGGDATWDGTPPLSAGGEYCGKQDLPFHPIQGSCANVP
ncbi:MAG: hypothetical protein WKG52_00645 [Variovorax sp.]